MRKSFLLLILIFVNCLSFATKEEVDSLQSVRDIELKKDLIFSKSLEWMSRTFVSAKSVIELQDKENGKIVGNISFPLSLNSTGLATLVITIKDNKYKIYLENLQERPNNQSGAAPSQLYSLHFSEAKDKFTQIDSELFAFLKGKNSKDNF